MKDKHSIFSFIAYLVLIVLGIIMLFFTQKSLGWILVIIAIGLILYGGISTFIYLYNKSNTKKPIYLVLYIAAFIVGILLWVFSYQIAPAIIPILIGVVVAIPAVFLIWKMFKMNKFNIKNALFPFIVSMLYILAGIIIVINLCIAGAIVSVFLGVMFIICGVIGICSDASIFIFKKRHNL